MSQTLEALHRLQLVERQLAEIRRSREAKAHRVERHQHLVKKAEQQLQEHQQALRKHQMRLDALQLDINVREEAIDKHRGALNKAKTNKEYAAILTALNTEKADSAKLETGVLQLMEEMQKLKDEADRIEAEQVNLAEDVARAEKALGEFDTKSKPERVGLEAKREQYAETLDPSALEAFSRVAQQNDGEALAPVAKLHPKRDEYTCSGCNMTLTLEVVNSLQTCNELQLCMVCGRILYIETAATLGSRA